MHIPMKYYYVGTYLPTLSFDTKPELNFWQLLTLLSDNLSEYDFNKVRSIRRLYDLFNLRSIWLEQPIDPYGQLDEGLLKDALVSGIGLPEYVYDFMLAYEKNEDRIRHFPSLLTKFFKNSEFQHDPFLKWYLEFERKLRLVLVGFRAKKLGKDLSVELQYEDPEEDFIAQLLAQKDEKVFEPPEGYEDLKHIFEKHFNDPMGLQREIDGYRFNAIESQLEEVDSFSITRILAYVIQFIIVNKWFELDEKEGKNIVDTIVKEV